MTASLSLSAARAALAERAPGLTIRKEDCGEYRVTFTQAAIAAAFPAMTRAELIAKAESLAAYETDAQAAMETGLAMSAVGLSPAEPEAATAEPEAAGYVDMTPTWASMGGTFRMVIENGSREGRDSIWGEINRALALADERNAMAARIAEAAQIARDVRGGLSSGGARDAIESIIAALAAN